MWTTVTIALLASSCCLAFPPRTIYDYKSDHLNHQQTGVAGRAVSGGYGWTAPNGQKFSVNYIADNKGYRIVSSQNVFPHEGKPLDVVKPIAAAAAKSFPPTSAVPVAPAKAKSASFSSSSKASSTSFYSPQAKSSLARSHFGLSGSVIDASQPQTTAAPTRRPITVIFFNTTPKPNKPSASVVPVPSRVNRPVVGQQPSAPIPVESEASVGGAEEPAAETAEGVEASGVKSAKSVSGVDGEAAPAEGTEAEGARAEGTEAEGAGAEDAGAEGAGTEGAEGSETEGAKTEGAETEGAEAEAGGEGGEAEGAEGEGGEEGGEAGEGREAGAEEEGAEEGQGEEGGEEEGEEEEGSEYGHEEEDEEESGSSSAGEEW